MNTSNMFTLNTRDYVNGLVVAVLTVVLTALQQSLSVCGLDIQCFDFMGIANMALSATLAYLVKNFVTNKDGKVGGVL